MNYFISIDFESFGGITPQNGFTQIGAVLFNADNDKIVSSFFMNAKQESFTVEKRCEEEFWLKHPELYEENKRKCAESQYNCYEVIDKFWEWVYSCHKYHNNNCYFIGDNVPYDYGILRYFSRNKDIMYAFGCYRDIVDVGIYYNAYAHCSLFTSKDIDNSSSSSAIKKVLNEDIPKFEIEHTHTAIDDASNIAYKWSWFNKKILQN